MKVFICKLGETDKVLKMKDSLEKIGVEVFFSDEDLKLNIQFAAASEADADHFILCTEKEYELIVDVQKQPRIPSYPYKVVSEFSSEIIRAVDILNKEYLTYV